MAIPKYNETMLPILKVLSDGKEYGGKDLVNELLKMYFKLSEEEKIKRFPDGTGPVFDHRVGWGKTYLKKAGLISSTRRGYVQITKEGEKVLKENLNEISIYYLKKYKSFQEFLNTKKETTPKNNKDEITNSTPLELIIEGQKQIEESLKNDLLEKLKETDPYYFESIILELFKKMGYGEFENTPKSRDGGIDGIISQDKLGIDRIYTQAKRYTKGNVNRNEIQNFIGAMSSDVTKGIFVTTTDFDKQAIEKAENDKHHKIIPINGKKLVELMIKYNVGVQTIKTLQIKEIDSDFFEDN